MKKLLVLFIILLLVVGGCTKIISPEKRIEELFEASRNLDVAHISELIDPSQLDNKEQIRKSFSEEELLSEGDPFTGKLLGYFRDSARLIDYELLELEIDGDEAWASLKVSHVDSSELLSEIFTELINRAFEFYKEDVDPDQVYSAIIDDVVPESLEPSFERELELELVKLDDKWYFKSLDRDFIDILSAGFIRAAENLDFFGDL